MSKWSATLRRGALGGLALLFACPAIADDDLHRTIRKQFRDKSYVLIEDQYGARLFVFSPGDGAYNSALVPVPPGSLEKALAMTRSAVASERVRGLTTLAGEPDAEALDAALVLLSDPDPAVREEAVNLIIDHPRGDVASIVAIAAIDPSPRVRDAVRDQTADTEED